MLQRLFRFALTGLANSAVGWAVIFGGLWAGMSGLAANAAGYAVGLMVSFTLNRHYVFGVRGAVSAREVLRFLAAFAFAYGVNVAVLLAALRHLQRHGLPAHRPHARPPSAHRRPRSSGARSAGRFP